LSDVALFFEVLPEFQHLPLAERRKAAYFAQQRAFRHWQTWLAMLFLFGATAGLAALAIVIASDPNGSTAGAFVGFSLGFAALHWAIYRNGLPYYRQALSDSTQLHPTTK
jgi:hypothetical protein